MCVVNPNLAGLMPSLLVEHQVLLRYPIGDSGLLQSRIAQIDLTESHIQPHGPDTAEALFALLSTDFAAAVIGDYLQVLKPPSQQPVSEDADREQPRCE